VKAVVLVHEGFSATIARRVNGRGLLREHANFGDRAQRGDCRGLGPEAEALQELDIRVEPLLLLPGCQLHLVLQN